MRSATPLDPAPPLPTLGAADLQRYAIGHYENFPVGSVLLPQPLRLPIAIIYRFARNADDFADEGNDPAAVRLAKLQHYRDQLHSISLGHTPAETLFQDLASIAAQYQLPLSLFDDLLDAFMQDVRQSRYQQHEELLDYARRSANPIGRLLLLLMGQRHPALLQASDHICTALQLINFWQDIAIDWQKDRVYLPQADMAQLGLSDADIARGQISPAWTTLFQQQLARAEVLLEAGAPLATALHGRFGLEIKLVVQAARTMVKKLAATQGDVFQHRPTLKKHDWPGLLLRALFLRTTAPRGWPQPSTHRDSL